MPCVMACVMAWGRILEHDFLSKHNVNVSESTFGTIALHDSKKRPGEQKRWNAS